MINPLYLEQTRLLLRVLPFVMQEECFALKGGTAINLFVRDLPRVSVDIDLVFLPDLARDAALAEIGRALRQIIKHVERNVPGTKALLVGKAVAQKVLVDGFGVQIKIEPNATIRGAVYEQEIRELAPTAKTMFETDMSARTTSFADLYAGKLCAALDRQHPRDLFDIKLLLDNEGITDAVRLAFVVYLASHPRPMVELLDPASQPLQASFDRNFTGMARHAVTVKDLEEVRDRLVPMILDSLTQNERKFLLSMTETYLESLKELVCIDDLGKRQRKLLLALLEKPLRPKDYKIVGFSSASDFTNVAKDLLRRHLLRKKEDQGTAVYYESAGPAVLARYCKLI